MIRANHPPAEVWRYTPRQIVAWVKVVEKERAGEMRERIYIVAAGQGAGSKDFDKLMRQLEDQSK